METPKRKLGRQSDLPVEDIKQMLDNGMRQVDVATIYDVSQGTISRIARLPEKPMRKNKGSARICTCCGERPIAKGNRFLCSVCFRNETVESHTVWA